MDIYLAEGLQSGNGYVGSCLSRARRKNKNRVIIFAVCYCLSGVRFYAQLVLNSFWGLVQSGFSEQEFRDLALKEILLADCGEVLLLGGGRNILMKNWTGNSSGLNHLNHTKEL